MTATEYADQRAHDVTWMTYTERAELDAGRYAVKATVHDWAWTYSNVTASEVQEIADRLTAHSGELWTVERVCELLAGTTFKR